MGRRSKESPGLNPKLNHGIKFGNVNVGNLCGRNTEKCKKLRKNWLVLQAGRWKNQEARFVGTQGRRYKLWWSGNDAGFGRVGILVKGNTWKHREI